MENDVYKEAIKNLANKTELEKTISVGLQGPPQLKLEEKRHHLGEFRERILLSISKGQVMKKNIYPEVKTALEDKRSRKMLIHGGIDHRFRAKYQKLASKMNIPYTIVHDPDLEGSIGLIIASDQAIDVENIQVTD